MQTWIVDSIENSLNSLQPRDCADIFSNGERTDGVYTVVVPIGRAHWSVEVFCDMTTDSGGWTVCCTISLLIMLIYFPLNRKFHE